MTEKSADDDDDTLFTRIREFLTQALSVMAATVIMYTPHNQLTTMGAVQASGVVSIASALLLTENLALARGALW